MTAKKQKQILLIAFLFFKSLRKNAAANTLFQCRHHLVVMHQLFNKIWVMRNTTRLLPVAAAEINDCSFYYIRKGSGRHPLQRPPQAYS